MKKFFGFGAALVVALGMGVAWGQGAPAGATSASEAGTLILNTYGVWRFASEIAPPVIEGGKEVTLRHAWLNYKTPAVEKEWTAPEFDDRQWHRGPVTLAPKTAMLARVCLRGKFVVTNVGAVKGLSLSVGYRGGVVVYVNGKEVKREHLAAGANLAGGPIEDRTLEMVIPGSALRKGVNVLGIEVVRAPYATEAADGMYEENSCQILSARLTAAGPAGIEPNAKRPEGFQVWNADVMSDDVDLDFGDAAEGLRPVVIVGAKNGTFTGKVVVGSTSAIKGLKATAGELKGQGGSIPGGNVEFRYGIPWGEYQQVSIGWRKAPLPYPAVTTDLRALSKEPLAEFPVMKVNTQGPLRADAAEGRSAPGAVVPVYIRVKVPATVGAGTYTGMVAIRAQGEKAVEVPVEVRVADWALPEVAGLHTFSDLIQCPDTLSLEYGVPLWSEKHWEMIAESFRLIGETSSRTVYIPLIVHTNFGNEESMVRWIKKGEGKYDYDFSLMDKYLDVATKNMGTPKQVIFVVWDVYMMPATTLEDATRGRAKDTARNIEKVGGEYGKGPRVTVVDPKTQKVEIVELPTHFDTEASRPLWKPLLDQLRVKMKARGLEDAMMLGVQHDTWATKEEHVFFKEISGDMPWVMHSHEGTPFGKRQYGISRMGYQAVVWTVTFTDDNAARPKGYRSGIVSHMGWAHPELIAVFDRFSREAGSNVYWSRLAEAAITGSQRGNGRLGADYWRVMKDGRGRRVGRSHDRYPESSWRNLFIPEALLAPGPTGPVGTDELEAYRLGLQECEARIVLEYGLDRQREKLGAELAGRCEAYLAKRHMLMWVGMGNLQLYLNAPGQKWADYMASGWGGGAGTNGAAWYLGSNRQEMTEELFRLAGEVTKKIGVLPMDVSKKDGQWPIHARN